VTPKTDLRSEHFRPVLRRTLLAVAVLTSAPLANAQTEQVTYYHVDAAGSVRMTTDASGQVTARYDYLPFGGDWPDPPAGQESRRFSAKEHDQVTGFDYFGGRYYASGTGRFISVDPILPMQAALLDPQLWNRYAYARNNPFRFKDPDGRCIWDLCIGEIAVATGASTATIAAFEAASAATVWLMSPPGRRATAELATSTASILTRSGEGLANFLQMARSNSPFADEWAKLGNLKGHLTPEDLEGALRDLAGDPVIGPLGRPFQHLKEVRDAQRGLRKLIEQLKGRIGSGKLSKEELEEAQRVLGDASRTLDRTEELVPQQ